MDSRESYQRFEEGDLGNDRLTPQLVEFIAERESFYIGSNNANGWPYIQFRGAKPGFLKVLDEKTLGFADFEGNRQYLTIGNLQDDDRVFLFLMDYAHRRRLKIWGRAQVFEDAETLSRVVDPDYPAEARRAIVVRVEAWDWNCPQHIPIKLSEEQVKAIVAPLQARIADLEAQLQGKETGN